MPMRSQAQRAFMHIHHPGIASRWEKETPKGKLPKHVSEESEQDVLKQIETAVYHEMERVHDPIRALDAAFTNLERDPAYYQKLQAQGQLRRAESLDHMLREYFGDRR